MLCEDGPAAIENCVSNLSRPINKSVNSASTATFTNGYNKSPREMFKRDPSYETISRIFSGCGIQSALTIKDVNQRFIFPLDGNCEELENDSLVPQRQASLVSNSAVPCEFGFLEDDECFFNIAEQANRVKTKSEFIRRPSNVTNSDPGSGETSKGDPSSLEKDGTPLAQVVRQQSFTKAERPLLPYRRGGQMQQVMENLEGEQEEDDEDIAQLLDQVRLRVAA